MQRVYVGMTADFLHHGHINLLQHARNLGAVTVGLLTDEAVLERKRLPALSFDERKKIIENIIGVQQVVPQKEWDYSANITLLKPDLMVHGNDWAQGPETGVRQRCLEALASYGGKLVEIPYTEGVSSGALKAATLDIGTTPDIRRKSLRRLLESKPLSRFIESHSPLSALIAEGASVESGGGVLRRFDGFWSSSLTDSTLLGKPDTEAVDLTHRLNTVNQTFEVTTLPMIFDGDTGGQSDHFEINVRSIERLGISAVIIEDKKGLKKNSLFGNEVLQFQEEPEVFGEKIHRGKKALMTSDFMIIARIESLILDAGLEDAIARARTYVEAGADGIMIHSRDKTPKSVFEFARIFRSDFPSIPLVCVPTTYSQVSENELVDHGFNIVIYANHMLRASYPAMAKTAEAILRGGRASEAEHLIGPIQHLLDLIPGTR